MNFTFNEKTFQALQIRTPAEQKVFLYQLGVVLTQIISAIQGGKIGAVNGNQLTLTSSALGTVSTSQTVPCANATAVTVSLSTGTAITLTLSNLQVGIPVVIRVAFTATVTLKLAATNPAGTAYSIIGITGTGAAVNLVTTGIGPGAISLLMPGNSVNEGATPTLYLGIVG